MSPLTALHALQSKFSVVLCLLQQKVAWGFLEFECCCGRHFARRFAGEIVEVDVPTRLHMSSWILGDSKEIDPIGSQHFGFCVQSDETHA